MNDDKLCISPDALIAMIVTEAQDRALIVQAFGAVHEIYQATEGFLASTCEHGVLHLNEEYVHVEPQWLDREQRRFVPGASLREMRPRAVNQYVEPRMQPQIGLDADPIVITVGVPAQRQQILPGAGKKLWFT